jgi:hypothetical protein
VKAAGGWWCEGSWRHAAGGWWLVADGWWLQVVVGGCLYTTIRQPPSHLKAELSCFEFVYK